MFITVSLLCGLVAVVYLYLAWKLDYWAKRGVPGPKPAIFVGNTPGVITRKRNVVYDLDDIYNNYKGKQRLVGFFSLRTPQIMLLDPELIKDVLIRNFKSFHDNEFADSIDKETDPIFANNPFMLKGEEWKEKRAEVTPAFTTSRLKAMYPLVENVCSGMVDFINLENTKKSPDGIDTRELTAKFTTDVVSSCIFGLDAESFKNSDAQIRKMGKELMTPGLRITIFFMIFQIVPFMQHFIKIPFVPKHIEKFFTNIMKDAIELRQRSKIDRADYLHYLLALRQKKNLSDLQMIAHAITFFTDGFETSSVAMASTLYELARNKRVQDKLRVEIRNFESKGDLSFDAIGEMEYLDQVITESLRLHPPAGAISKKCTEKTSMKIFHSPSSPELQIDVGNIISIPIYSVHHDPDNYKDPKAFNPERFDPENGGLKAFKDKGVFLSFGDGPRICIGQKFALMQVKAGIINIIKNFELTVNPKTQEPLVMDPETFIILPIGGFWLNYKKL